MKTNKLMTEVLKGLLVAAAVVVAGPHLVSAQDLNASVSNLTTNELIDIPDLIDACFYIAGAAFIGTGLLKLKAYADAPANNPLGQGVGRVSVGCGLLALPYVAAALISTFDVTTGTQAYATFAKPN